MSKNQFSDLDRQFQPNPFGDIKVVKEARAIEQSLINILLTQKGERAMRPNFGTNLRKAVFDQNDLVTDQFIFSQVNEAFEQESRAELVDVISEKDGLERDVTVLWDSPFLSELQRTTLVIEEGDIGVQ
mgnify:CR=1 FL=1